MRSNGADQSGQSAEVVQTDETIGEREYADHGGRAPQDPNGLAVCHSTLANLP